jgi:hypothetical protein
MTKEEILKMEPGREMDALVAEKVMGWTKKWNNFSGANDWMGYGTGTRNDRNWKPSEDISAAWEVVERIKTKDAFQYVGDLHIVWGGFGENLTPKGPHGQMIYPNALCWLVSIETETNTYRVTANTAPEAICKAALLACLEGK